MKHTFMLLTGALLLAAARLHAQVFDISPNQPPGTGEFRFNTPMNYTGGLVVSDFRISGFNNVQRTVNSPDTIVAYGLAFSFTLGGVGPSPLIVAGNGNTIQQFSNYSSGNTGTFQTEMLSLNLQGVGIMIRESPTLSSPGQTTITPGAAGGFHIGSFFDVFTELSIDGGQTWNPQTSGSAHTTLTPVPEPEAYAVIAGLGLLGLAGWRRWHRP